MGGYANPCRDPECPLEGRHEEHPRSDELPDFEAIAKAHYDDDCSLGGEVYTDSKALARRLRDAYNAGLERAAKLLDADESGEAHWPSTLAARVRELKLGEPRVLYGAHRDPCPARAPNGYACCAQRGHAGPHAITHGTTRYPYYAVTHEWTDEGGRGR